MITRLKQTDMGNGGFEYRLTDSKSNNTSFKIYYTDWFAIANCILQSIHEHYQFSKECPFRNVLEYIRLMRPNWMNDEIIRGTIFYSTYKQVMDEVILAPPKDHKKINWSQAQLGAYITATTTTPLNIGDAYMTFAYRNTAAQ